MDHSPLFHEPEAEYHSGFAIGSTTAKKALVSVRHAKDHMEGIDKPESSGFSLGKAWDELITGTPSYVVRPEGLDGRTKEGKAWLAENEGKNVLKVEEAGDLYRMTSRVPPEIATMFGLTKSEDAFQLVGRVPLAHGLTVQCRIDMLIGRLAYDLKTTSKPIEDFGRSAFQYGYHIQAGWYMMVCQMAGFPLDGFRFIVTETKSPYRTVEFIPDSEFLEKGYAQACEALRRLQLAFEFDNWNDQTTGPMTLSLPKWATKGGSQPEFSE